MFLALSYFGTDQSQVGRYLSGASLRESRLGLMFNAVCKIPMQFLILMLGVLTFVFYQFETPPVFFNEAAWNAAGRAWVRRTACVALRTRSLPPRTRRKAGSYNEWVAARQAGDPRAAAAARESASTARDQADAARAQTKAVLHAANPRTGGNDADYVFITFIVRNLPHGFIGLLVAAFFAAALSSKAGELSALGFHHHSGYLPAHRAGGGRCALRASLALVHGNLGVSRHWVRAQHPDGGEPHSSGEHPRLYFLWRDAGPVPGGVLSCGVCAAPPCSGARSTAQMLVIVLYCNLSISYLWYNVIGCAACVLGSLLCQAAFGAGAGEPPSLSPSQP